MEVSTPNEIMVDSFLDQAELELVTKSWKKWIVGQWPVVLVGQQQMMNVSCSALLWKSLHRKDRRNVCLHGRLV